MLGIRICSDPNIFGRIRIRSPRLGLRTVYHLGPEIEKLNAIYLHTHQYMYADFYFMKS
jgi:hypothetical protein